MFADSEIRTVAQQIFEREGYSRLAANVFRQDNLNDSLSNVIAVLGPSRCGKDTLSLLMSRITTHTYSGTCSLNAALSVWYGWLELTKQVLVDVGYTNIRDFYADRHKHKMFWFNYLNHLRDIDPLIVPAMALCNGNILTGVRSLRELEAVAPYVKSAIWVERSGVANDLTLEFDYSDVARLFGDNCRVLTNPGDVKGLTERFLKLSEHLPVTLDLSPKEIRFKTPNGLWIGA